MVLYQNEENNKTKTCVVYYDDKSAVYFEKPISHRCKHHQQTICTDRHEYSIRNSLSMLPAEFVG